MVTDEQLAMLSVALERKRKTHEVVRECLATVQRVAKSASTINAATDHDLTGSASGKLATMTTASSLASSTSTLAPEATITIPVAAPELSLMAHTKCSMPGSYNATRVLVSAATSSALSTVSFESTPCQAVARIIPIATIDYQTVTRSRCWTPDSVKQEVASLCNQPTCHNACKSI